MLYENQIFTEHNHNITTHKWTKYKCTSELELSYELVICVTCGRVFGSSHNICIYIFTRTE